MIHLKKELLEFEYLYKIVKKYEKLRLETLEENDCEEAKEEYFDILGDIIYDVSEITSIQYTKKVLALENSEEYFENQILQAASAFDLELLRIIVMSPLFNPIFMTLKEQIIFLTLVKLVETYQNRAERGEELLLGHVFEQFVERFGDSELSTQLLNMIFDLDKVGEDWYYSMMPSIFKLRSNITVSKISFELLKKGLNCPLSDIKHQFEEDIERHFIKKGLVDEHYNWIGEE